MLALQELWESRLDPLVLANDLGADVTMCLYSKPLHAQGIGDVIEPLSNIAPIHIVLVNHNVEVSTPAIFKALANKKNPEIGGETLSDMRNDLQPSAIEHAPVIGEVLSALEKLNPVFARMSGSGATCFGIFETTQEAENAKNKLSSMHPDWWSVATTTLAS